MNKKMIAKKLKELRLLKGISQTKLASILSLSRQSISKWESFETVPSIEYLIELSKYYGVSINYIVEDYASISSLEEVVYLSDDVLYSILRTFTTEKLSKAVKILSPSAYDKFTEALGEDFELLKLSGVEVSEIEKIHYEIVTAINSAIQC